MIDKIIKIMALVLLALMLASNLMINKNMDRLINRVDLIDTNTRSELWGNDANNLKSKY